MTNERFDLDWEHHLAESAENHLHAVKSDQDEIAKAARALGYELFDLDLSRVASRDELWDVPASEMRFPAHFGRNWDALLDMMSDLSWAPANGYVLVIRGTAQARRSCKEGVSVFIDVVVDAMDRMRSYGVPYHVIVVGDPRETGIENAVAPESICLHDER